VRAQDSPGLWLGACGQLAWREPQHGRQAAKKLAASL
jgi:hypothetical protein